MMSVNAVLMKFFQLPPAVRMILALAGFGSLASLFFAFKRYFTSAFGWKLALIILGIGIGLFLLVWGIRRTFFRKKSATLGAALESQGPTRGDIAEQEQIISQKFREKLKALKETGLNVYQMPWFVLVGEPGCGKTASLIHSGLDFPLGRDEVPGFGGTRNYNWWFTSEAVVLDTAGRIAFHEEGTTDRVEWEHFLRLIKKHRPRCPVNGVIIALPANKLLQDTAEERIDKASILRDRLRQIHQLLGVRFPTFLLVTKTDLVGGFSEFFEEMRVDLAQRNQMIGWSRPGEFQAQYDPETFDATFDDVQTRMRAWALRYLFQRRTTDEEMGMIATFPEAFRDLKKPLGDYVKTIFQKSPLLEPPFFRGFYFTSAVQEGAPIFDILTRTRPGNVTTEVHRPKTVDSKPFFIHDLYARKVFPEQGLVFRSAKHVSLNKRLRRFVWAGSAALLVIMLSFWGFGYFATREIVEKPQGLSKDATAVVVRHVDASQPPEATPPLSDIELRLDHAAQLLAKIAEFDDGWSRLRARMLYILASLSQPQNNLRTVHAGYVARGVLKPIADLTAERLRTSDLAALSDEEIKLHQDALEAYARWYGHAVGAKPRSGLVAEVVGGAVRDVETWLRYASKGQDELLQRMLPKVREQLDPAFRHYAGGDGLEFSRVVLLGAADYDPEVATETLIQAIARLRDYAEKKHADAGKLAADSAARWWLDLLARLGAVDQRYGELLAARRAIESGQDRDAAMKELKLLLAPVPAIPEGQEASEEVKRSFRWAWAELTKHLENIERQPRVDGKLVRINQLAAMQSANWTKWFEPIRSGLEQGEAKAERVRDAIAAAEKQLAAAFAKSFRSQFAGIEGFESGLEDILTSERYGPLFAEIKTRKLASGAEEEVLALHTDALGKDSVLRFYLEEIEAMLDSQRQSPEALRRELRSWPQYLTNMQGRGTELRRWADTAAAATDATREAETRLQSKLAPALEMWRPVELYNLQDALWTYKSGEARAALLNAMKDAAELATNDAAFPGVGSMLPDYESSILTNVFRRDDSVAAPAVGEAPPKPEPARPVSRFDEPAQPPPTGAAESAEKEPLSPDASRIDPGALLCRYYDVGRLVEALKAAGAARKAIDACAAENPPREVIAAAEAAKRALDESVDAYAREYFQRWNGLYEDPTQLLQPEVRTMIRRCAEARTWAEFQQAIQSAGAIPGEKVRESARHVILNSVDSAFYNRPDGPFADELGRLQDVLVEICGAKPCVTTELRSTVVQLDKLDPIVQTIADAWKKYADDVAPTNSAANATEALRRLEENIVYGSATNTDMKFIRPLLDVARRGAALQTQNVTDELRDIFHRVSGYPVGSNSAAGSTTADVPGFLSMLREAEEFAKRHPKIAEQHKVTFDRCREWQALATKAVEVHVNYFEPRDVKNKPRQVYAKLTVTLPLRGDSARQFDFDSNLVADEYSVNLAPKGRNGFWMLTEDLRGEYLLQLFGPNDWARQSGLAESPTSISAPSGQSGSALFLPWMLAKYGNYQVNGDWILAADFQLQPNETYKGNLVLRFGGEGTLPGGDDAKGCIPIPEVSGGAGAAGGAVDLARYLRPPNRG